MIFWYKNSFLASVVSIFGCGLAMVGLASFGDSILMALVFLAIGFALMVWGRIISDNKAFKKWWKQIKDNNLEPVIAKDLNTAIAIYRKNPDGRTISEIAKLNPSFAAYIQQNIAAKK